MCAVGEVCGAAGEVCGAAGEVCVLLVRCVCCW